MNLIKKGLRFAIAYTRWAKAGKPLRDDEYIFELYDNHCKPCEQFVKHNTNEGHCAQCGCHIKRVSSQEDTINKLAWPTESCPLNYWGADIDEEESTN